MTTNPAKRTDPPTIAAASHGWEIVRAADVEWLPWGAAGDARAKVLGSADGYLVAHVEAPAGYTGTPHEHAHAEFLYVLDGRLRTEGHVMHPGDGYAAGAGSHHGEFVAETDAAYVSVFKL